MLAYIAAGGCGGGTTTEFDSVTIDDHLYLKGPDGTELGIRVGMDATGKDALTVTRVGE
jgi:hypothetical protein